MKTTHRQRAASHSLPGMLVVAAVLMTATAAATPLSVTPGPSAAQRLQACEPPTFGRDRLTMVCMLDGTAAPQALHIKVHFTGSHDDTTASLDVAIGDAAVACDAGSKTSTEGEDGDVTLDCRFTASGKPGAALVLRASAKWFHAQYIGLEVNGRRP
jgi:hypothetical protein